MRKDSYAQLTKESSSITSALKNHRFHTMDHKLQSNSEAIWVGKQSRVK